MDSEDLADLEEGVQAQGPCPARARCLPRVLEGWEAMDILEWAEPCLDPHQCHHQCPELRRWEDPWEWEVIHPMDRTDANTWKVYSQLSPFPTRLWTVLLVVLSANVSSLTDSSKIVN